MTERPPLGRFRCLTCGTLVPPPSAAGTTCPACVTHYPLEEGIIALTPPHQDIDYPEPLVTLVASVEGRHFWFSARNEVIVSTLQRVIGPLPGTRVLDVGCGTGFVLGALESAGLHTCGIDMHHAALRFARSRVRGPLFRSNVASLPFERDFDLVTLFDVIEHVDDDVAVLQEAGRVLMPGGYVAVTVPAGPGLWTVYDEVIGHKRRYDRTTLTGALTRAGFELCEVGYFSCLPALVQVIQRRMSRSDAGSRDRLEIVRRALKIPPAPLNALLHSLVRLEAPLRRTRWIRGGSLIAVGCRT